MVLDNLAELRDLKSTVYTKNQFWTFNMVYLRGLFGAETGNILLSVRLYIPNSNQSKVIVIW